MVSNLSFLCVNHKTLSRKQLITLMTQMRPPDTTFAPEPLSKIPTHRDPPPRQQQFSGSPPAEAPDFSAPAMPEMKYAYANIRYELSSPSSLLKDPPPPYLLLERTPSRRTFGPTH